MKGKMLCINKKNDDFDQTRQKVLILSQIYLLDNLSLIISVEEDQDNKEENGNEERRHR